MKWKLSGQEGFWSLGLFYSKLYYNATEAYVM